MKSPMLSGSVVLLAACGDAASSEELETLSKQVEAQSATLEAQAAEIAALQDELSALSRQEDLTELEGDDPAGGLRAQIEVAAV